MKINVRIKPNLRIRAFYLFFIIVSVQAGVGILTAPRLIFNDAKQDSWLAILLAYALMLIVIWIMFYILNQYKNADIFGIQVDLFGSFIGKLLGLIYILSFLVSIISILLIYIEIVQVFLYPTLNAFLIGVLILSLVAYTVLGGVKVIVGVCFLFLFLTQWVLFLLYDPFLHISWDHYLPMFDTALPDLLEGTRATTYNLAGFNFLFLFYPFIQNKEKAKLPVFLAVSYITFILLLTTMLTIGYYSLNNISAIEWPGLTLFKSVSFTFIERVDYLVIAEWLLILIPNNVILMWGITYGLKRLYLIPQKHTLIGVSIIILFIISIVKSNHIINQVSNVVSTFLFYLIFIYPMILLPIVYFKKKRTKRKRGNK